MTKKTEFLRIFSPRTEKAVKAISLLTNGVRYSPTSTETEHMLEVLKDAVNDIAGLYGKLPAAPLKQTENAENAGAATPGLESLVEASRIDRKIASIKASPFARQDVSANVASIPEAQLTAYATHILARLCSKFEEAEAQPKNHAAKDAEDKR